MSVPPSAPLAGTTVVDLTRVLSGPFATMILGDLGADVIKVERLDGGDDTRHIPPTYRGESHYFLSVNRNKRSIAVDLKSRRGVDVVCALAAKADVVVENFRPGVAAALGLDYDTLSVDNERLVYCSISGFGQTGPLAQRAAFDIVVQALSGAMSVNGHDGAPVKLGIPIGDLSAGVFGAIGILGALAARERTGKGACIDVGMLDATMGLLGHLAGQYLMTGTSPQPVGSGHHSIAPYGVYAAADGDVVVATLTPAFWPRVCRALEIGVLEHDPRFATNEARLRNRRALDGLIEERLATGSVADWCERFAAEDVPHAPILGVGEALEQPQARERGAIWAVPHAVLGEIRIPGPVIHFAGEEPTPVRAPPVLGEHTDAVLRDVLGLPDDAVRALVIDGVVGTGGTAHADPPVGPPTS